MGSRVGPAVGQAGANLATLFGVSVGDSTLNLNILAIPTNGSAGLVSRYNATTGDEYLGEIISTYSATTKKTTYTAEIWSAVNGVWTELTSTPLTGALNTGTGTLSFEAPLARYCSSTIHSIGRPWQSQPGT